MRSASYDTINALYSNHEDLCDTCQHFRNGLQYNARKEEEVKDLLKIQRTFS